MSGYTQRAPGPQIWLQGDPEEIRDLMPLGISGIITNNIILRDMAQKYNDLKSLLDKYLELSLIHISEPTRPY